MLGKLCRPRQAQRANAEVAVELRLTMGAAIRPDRTQSEASHPLLVAPETSTVNSEGPPLPRGRGKHQRPSVRRKARSFVVEAISEIRFAGVVSGVTASLGAGRNLNHLNHQLRFDLNFGSIVLVKWSAKGTF